MNTDIENCQHKWKGKEQVRRIPIRGLVGLQEIIYSAVKNVTRQMLHNTWVEVEYRLDISRAINGSHVDVHGI